MLSSLSTELLSSDRRPGLAAGPWRGRASASLGKGLCTDGRAWGGSAGLAPSVGLQKPRGGLPGGPAPLSLLDLERQLLRWTCSL